MTTMPTLSDEDLAALEAKELENALAKVNGGGSLSRRERELLKEAHERGKKTSSTTELGFCVDLSLEALEQEGRWPDLSRLRARQPEKLDTAAMLLAAKVPVRTICEKLRLSPCTLQAIMDDPELGQSVVTQRAELVKNMKLAHRLAVEHQVELAERGELDPLAVKLLFDQIQLLDGGATSRSEHVVVTISPAELALNKLLAASRGMGLEAQNALPMAVPAVGDAMSQTALPSGSEALADSFSVNESRDVDVVLLSNDPRQSSKFQPGGEGVEAPRPP